MPAGPITRISDIIVPEIYAAYMQKRTMENVRLLQAGIMRQEVLLNNSLQGGGNTFELPFFNDLTSDEERTSTDTIPAAFTGGTNDPDPMKITARKQTGVRLERNQSWASSQLAASLAGADPMQAIASLTANYWARRLQQAAISVIQGVFAANAAPPTAASQHKQNDLTVNISGAAFKAGATEISGNGVLDALATMGDASSELTVMMVHSGVMTKLRKQNLIAFIPTSEGRVGFESYLGRRIIETDAIPVNGSVYETWFFRPGAILMGVAATPNAVEVQRLPGAGNGGGAEVLYNRVRWCLHPDGHAYAIAAQGGGPDNATLSDSKSWARVYGERKQIGLARIISRES